jgi:phosphocarrier protein
VTAARGSAGRPPLPVDPEARADCRIDHRPGLHVRAAAAFARRAQTFRCEVRVEALGTRADGKSVIELLSLAAPFGSTLSIAARGPDAGDAVETLADLVAQDFMEDWT